MNRITKFLVTVSAAACIAFPLAACNGGSKTLESPTGFSLDEAYNLTWSPVENARSYLIDVKEVETGETKEATTRRENIALSYLEVGDYDIRVRAVGDGSHFYDSEWSVAVSFNRAYESGCQYRLINNGSEYEIVSASVTATELVLEDIYRGKPVTSVGESAFRRASSLETLTLGSYVTNIGEGAFYNCLSLKSISMPDSVASIGISAFQNCSDLESFTVPAGVREIQPSTFAYCRKLTAIDLNNVTVIGDAAFDNCSGLTEFSFPDSVGSIGKRAFSSASKLNKITLGSGVETIGDDAFSGCSALREVKFGEPSALKSIGSNAFRLCAMSEIVLPDGLESIGALAFYYAGNLNSVTIPDSVTAVGNAAFFATKFYTDAYNAGDRFLYADDWVVGCHFGTDEKFVKLVAAEDPIDPTAFTLREGIVGIADNTFANQKKLQTVIIAPSIKYVGAGAFYQCPDLFRFSAAEGSELISLGDYALAKNEQLTSVSFEGTMTTSKLKVIGDNAFDGCTMFDHRSDESATMFPKSLQRIGKQAFRGTALYRNEDNIEKDGVIYADDWVVGCLGSPTQNEDGSIVPGENPQAVVQLKEKTKGIADYAFYKCTSLESVMNSSGVEKIGRAAFAECENLSSFAMGSKLTKVEDYAFYNCKNLIVSSLPYNLRSIGKSAFYGCAQMLSAELPASLESVGDYAYYGCTNLSSVVIGAKMENIGNYVFYGCSRLKSVTIPSNIQKVGKSAFSGCVSLESLTIEDGVKEIGDFAFRSNQALESIALPASVKTVGYGAFLQCENVKNIDFGRVESIGDFAFAENFGVSNLVIPDSVKTIGNGAFYYLGAGAVGGSGEALGSVKSVVISGNVEKIGAHAFYGCNFATVFLADENRNEVWGVGWNSSRRPAIWGVTLSEDKSFVVSFTVGENTFDYFDPLNGIGVPYREGYKFAGWSLSENGEEVAFTMENVMNAPVGTTLYAVYIHD